MKHYLFSQLLHRGRKLLSPRRQKARQLARPFPRLETLEERCLLSAGFGGLSFLERVVPLTIEISFQQPAVVRQPSVSISFVGQSESQELFSVLGSTTSGSQNTSMANSGTNSGGLLSGLLNPVTSTVSNLLNPLTATVGNLVTPVTSTVSAVLHGTQPLVTNTTTVLPATLPLVPNLLSGVPQASPPPLPLVSNVGVTPTANLIAPTGGRTGATVPLTANAGASPLSITLPPEQPPSTEAPSAPTGSAPVAPPVLPDPAPETPSVPPVVPEVLKDAPVSTNPDQTSAVAPLVVPAAPTAQPDASPSVNAETAAVLSVNAASGKGVAVDFAALLFGPSTTAVPAANSVSESQTADVSASGQGLEMGRPELSFAATALGGGLFTDLETYVFADAGDLSDAAVPAGTTDVPLSPGEHNDVSVPVPTGETANTLVAVSDEVFTSGVAGTARDMTAAAKELLAPTADHWLRYVAPVFIAAGAYLGTRLAQRKKTNEHLRPALGLCGGSE